MSEAQPITQTNQIIYSNLERLAPKINGFIISELLYSKRVLPEEDYTAIRVSKDYLNC